MKGIRSEFTAAVGEGRTLAPCEALLVAGFAVRVQEEYDAARGLLVEALTISRTIRHAFITAASLQHLGIMEAVRGGNHAAARRLLEKGLTTYRTLGLRRFIALVLFSVGDIARADQEYARSRDLLRAGLASMLEVREKLGIAGALDTFAHLAADGGRQSGRWGFPLPRPGYAPLRARMRRIALD